MSSNKELTITELYECYCDTVSKCGVFLLNKDFTTISNYVYEEFDIGVHTFLHIDCLNKLLNANLISSEIKIKSIELREKVLKLQKVSGWRIANFKTSDKWKEIMILCDEIKKMK